MQTVSPVDGAFAQVVEVSHRQFGKAFELLAVVDLELALENATRRRPGETLLYLVDMRQENDVGAAVLRGEAAPSIGCRPNALFAQKLPDEASQLGAA